jgi:cobalt-zinc-cadmium efflux system outer membrane protein
MRWLLVLALAACPAGVMAQAGARALTLPEALAAAEEGSPVLRRARAALSAAEGESRGASALLHNNPELNLERARRKATDAEGLGIRYQESAIGLSQPLEIGGQQGHRREAARHSLAAAQAEILDAQVRVRAEVEMAFAQVLLLQRRLASEEQNARLAEDAAAAVGKRVSAGEDSKLDGNLSSVEAERGRNHVATLREQLLEARASLASLLQLPASDFPEVAGELPDRISGYRLEELVAQAAERPQLRALGEREAAAQSRLQLERASVIPNLTVGLASAREGPAEARERATILSISVPLPLFNRNQAGIGRALTERDQAQIERQAATRNGEAVIRELWQRLVSLEARLARLGNAVLPRLDENLGLSTKAYRAGEIGILQLVLVNRQALDARRDYLDALADFTRARIALEQTAGVHRLKPRDVRPSSTYSISKP